MLVESKCRYCDGSGIRIIESSTFLGILKKSLPSTCEYCHGRGSMLDLPTCHFCEGQGLVGNESETCRPCNGTGKADAFSFIPREKLMVGTHFHRRCDLCGRTEFELVSAVEEKKLTRSWESEEELRHVELVEQVWVRCKGCTNRYSILIDPEMHHELELQTIAALEDMGIDLGYIHQPS